MNKINSFFKLKIYQTPGAPEQPLFNAVPLAVQTFWPVPVSYEKSGYRELSSDINEIAPVLTHWGVVPAAIVTPAIWNPPVLLYPSRDGTTKVAFAPTPVSAIYAAHSLAIVAIVFAAAVALALPLILVKEGIAIADRTARTATTTTNSINENPSSPGFLERALLALGLFKYACNGVIF